MTNKQEELLKALTRRFIQVTLKDGTVHAGFIGNPEDFKVEMPADMVLINGLLRDSVKVADVIDVEFPNREDTTSIPVVQTEVKNEKKKKLM